METRKLEMETIANKVLPAKRSSKGLNQGQMIETFILLSALGGENIDDVILFYEPFGYFLSRVMFAFPTNLFSQDSSPQMCVLRNHLNVDVKRFQNSFPVELFLFLGAADNFVSLWCHFMNLYREAVFFRI